MCEFPSNIYPCIYGSQLLLPAGILDNTSGSDQLKFIRAIPSLIKSSHHDLDEVSDVNGACAADYVICRCVKS